MKDLHLVAVGGGEDPPAGAGGYGADRAHSGPRAARADSPDDQAPLLDQPLDPVLGCRAGDLQGLCDIGDLKIASFKRD